MEISNLTTVLIVVVAMGSHLVIVTNKISKFMGTTEETLKSLKEQITNVSSICSNCYLKDRINKVEDKQDELRKDWKDLPARLSIIERDIKLILKVQDRDRPDRHSSHDRMEDL